MDILNKLIATPIILLFVFAECLSSPFDFTFTDPPDYIWITLIPLTIFLLVRHYWKIPKSASWLRFAAVLAWVLAIATPLAPLAALYRLAHRGGTLIGHWPVMWQDDPKYIDGDDPIYHALYTQLVHAFAFAGWSIITFIGLCIHLRGYLSKAALLSLICVFIAAWLAFIYEPGQRYLWWLD